MEFVQNSWSGMRTLFALLGDSFIVALAITGAVSAAVTLATFLFYSV